MQNQTYLSDIMSKKFDFIDTKFIAKWEKATGIKIYLDIFPWKYLGWSDEEFLTKKIHFSHGPLIPKDHQRKLLGVVREQEKLLLEQHEHDTKREKAMGKPPKYKQLELFT
jgi:hypothetical protein